MKSRTVTSYYKENKFELDLTYITEQFIVTANFYQNDKLNEFKSFLNTIKADYKIFNLCTEPEFNIEADINNVENHPIPPGCAGAIASLFGICGNLEALFRKDPSNVAVIHCKTGKDRSCMVAACYLLYSGQYESAEEAIQHVNELRSPHTLNALSGPSVLRYINYFAKLLKSNIYSAPENIDTYKIEFLRMTSIPRFSASIGNSGCTPEISVSLLSAADDEVSADGDRRCRWYPKRVFSHLDHVDITDLSFAAADSVKSIDIFLEDFDVFIRGDVVISLFSGHDKMCQVSFHTSAVLEKDLLDGYIKWDKNDVDIAFRDLNNYTFQSSFKLELYLQQVPGDNPSLNTIKPISDAEQPYSPTNSELAIEKEQFMFSHGDLPIDESDVEE